MACYKIEQTQPDASRGGIPASVFCASSAVIECGQGVSPGITVPRVQGPPERSYEPEHTEHLPAARTAAAPKLTSDEKYLSMFVVRGGWLKISTSSMYGDTPNIKAYIKYNDNLIEEFSDLILSIDAFVTVASNSVLIYSTNPGGSGTVDSHGLISIDDKGKIYRATLPAGYERFEYQVGNDRINFELGIEEGKEVRAVFASGRLDVSKTAIPKGALRDQDCDMLYNGLLNECARPEQRSCTYDDMALSMANQRPVNLMAYNNPNYRDADFKAACEQACKAKRKPSFAGFRKTICQPR